MLGWVDDNSPSNTLSYQYVHVQCPSWQLLKCQKVNMLLALALWRPLHGYIFYRALSLSLTIFHWSFWTSFMNWVIHSILEQNWIEISFIFSHWGNLWQMDSFTHSFTQTGTTLQFPKLECCLTWFNLPSATHETTFRILNNYDISYMVFCASGNIKCGQFIFLLLMQLAVFSLETTLASTSTNRKCWIPFEVSHTQMSVPGEVLVENGPLV